MMLRTPELLWGLLLIGCAGKKPTFSCCFWDAGSSAGVRGGRAVELREPRPCARSPELRGFAPNPDKLSRGLESVDAPGNDLRAAGCSFPAADAASSVRVRGRVAPPDARIRRAGLWRRVEVMRRRPLRLSDHRGDKLCAACVTAHGWGVSGAFGAVSPVDGASRGRRWDPDQRS